MPDVPGHAPRGFEFVVAQDGVERDEDAGADVRRAIEGLLALGPVRAGEP